MNGLTDKGCEAWVSDTGLTAKEVQAVHDRYQAILGERKNLERAATLPPSGEDISDQVILDERTKPPSMGAKN